MGKIQGSWTACRTMSKRCRATTSGESRRVGGCTIERVCDEGSTDGPEFGVSHLNLITFHQTSPIRPSHAQTIQQQTPPHSRARLLGTLLIGSARIPREKASRHSQRSCPRHSQRRLTVQNVLPAFQKPSRGVHHRARAPHSDDDMSH